MWTIYERADLYRVLTKLPREILKRYEKWKDVVRISGPQGLRAIKGFHDEKLKGEWSEYRSSRLNEQYRVIYRMKGEEFRVYVVRISAHDYRR